MDTQLVIQGVLALFGAGGVLGALVALFKLKPEANSMAVTQAQGAAQMWKDLYETCAAEKAREEAEHDRCVAELRERIRGLQNEVQLLEAARRRERRGS